MKGKAPRIYTDKFIKDADKYARGVHGGITADQRLTLDQMLNVINNVEEHLAVKGLTHYQLGMIAGCQSHSYRQSWWCSIRRKLVRGDFYDPKLRTLLKLTRATGKTVAQLLEGYKDGNDEGK